MTGAVALPSLRQELRMQPGAALTNGAPSWTLCDPLRHVFFQLGEVEFQIFRGWASGGLATTAAVLKSRGLNEAEVDRAFAEVVDFALTNQLTQSPIADATATFAALHAARRRSWWKLALDNYLFFRVPLVRPAAFLARTLRFVEPLYSRAALLAFLALALTNFYFVARQFDHFLATFMNFLSWDGLIAYALGLSAVKVIHELGHAYTATRYGARVPTMGVSFLLLFPVLYTDTTGAWAITSRRKRLGIDVAGVSAELLCAVLCTSAWLLLPDGALRSVAFVLATSSWVLSIGININPFMRFDGYYLLSDLINVPNLQTRASALHGWALRRLLFALPDAPPEELSGRLRNSLIVYAAFAALYRVVLFTGIAAILYLTVFKPVGALLAAIEIGIFVVRPVIMEMRRWWDRHADIWAAGRGRWLLAALFSGVLLAAMPLDRSVSAPAILAPTRVQPIVAGSPARIERVHVRNGQQVRRGDIIIELRAPELAQGEAQHQARVAALEARLARGVASADDLSNQGVIERELTAERAALGILATRRDRLVVHARHDGVVTDWGADLHPGRWIGGDEVLGQVIRPGRFDVIALVNEDDAMRVAPLAAARFIPDDAMLGSRRARVVELGTTAVQRLDIALLASTNGGPVPVREEADGRLRPEAALYLARLQVPIEPGGGSGQWMRPITGEVSIAARGESLLGRAMRAVLRLFRSEAALF